jgi:hypothetical protein
MNWGMNNSPVGGRSSQTVSRQRHEQLANDVTNQPTNSKAFLRSGESVRPVFERANHRSLSGTRRIHSALPHLINLITILILPPHRRLDLLKGNFSLRFPTKMCPPFFISHTHPKCQAHLIMLALIILITR